MSRKMETMSKKTCVIAHIHKNYLENMHRTPFTKYEYCYKPQSENKKMNPKNLGANMEKVQP